MLLPKTISTILNNIGHYLNIQSHYDDSNNIIECPASKLNAIIKIVVIITAYAVTIVENVVIDYEHFGLSFTALDAGQYTLGVLIIVFGVLKTSFFPDKHKWSTYYKHLNYAETCLAEAHIDCDWLKRAFKIYWCFDFLEFCLVLVAHYVFMNILGEHAAITYFVYISCGSYSTFLIMIYVWNVIKIGAIFKGLRELLAITIKTSEKGINNPTNLKNILRISNLCTTCCKSLNILNETYGWFVVFTFFYFGLLGLSCMHLSAHMFIIYMKTKEINLPFIILNFFGTSYTIFKYVLTSYICDLSYKNHQEIVLLSSKLESSFPLNSQEKRELTILTRLLKSQTSGFTAAGIFKIDRQMVYALLSTILTYYIVLIQFDTLHYTEVAGRK